MQRKHILKKCVFSELHEWIFYYNPAFSSGLLYYDTKHSLKYLGKNVYTLKLIIVEIR